MDRKPLSPKQQEIYDYIKSEIVNHFYTPSVREICEYAHLKSTSSVFVHLQAIERKGYIKRDPYEHRKIEIVDLDISPVQQSMVSVPIIGTVAAGLPILAEENIDGYFPVPTEMLPHGESFILKVKGDSMINAGILSGDHIFVRCCNTADNGDMVVALVDDSATVKTYYKEKGHFRLQPENDTMDPIIVDDLTILGKVFGVYRFFKN